MSINAKQLKMVIGQVLIEMNKYSNEAVGLLMLTSATESRMGTYLYQLCDGPARGIFQMEKGRDLELISRYVSKKDLTGYDKKMIEVSKNVRSLTLNIEYQIWIARWFYYQFSEAIPRKEDGNYILMLANYWKKYWNTKSGAGNRAQAVKAYRIYTMGFD